MVAALVPLLRLLRQNKISIIGLLQHLVSGMHEAPDSLQSIFNSFVRLTKEELWNSEEELRAYVRADNNYEKLLKGEIGINLIQTHTAMSLAVMDDWVRYVFETAAKMLGDDIDDNVEASEILARCEGLLLGAHPQSMGRRS